MDGPGLSSRERRILAETEDGLRADRRLRTMRLVLPGGAGRPLDAAAQLPPTSRKVNRGEPASIAP
ncbi:hypothetical protein [Kitasatospora sp. NPDC057500]|uniref:hypothetical protein n=1 Tax=Kitasatospora sp. NPDC057500 TaxID=3346151 RepID=UPI0036A84B0A